MEGPREKRANRSRKLIEHISSCSGYDRLIYYTFSGKEKEILYRECWRGSSAFPEAIRVDPELYDFLKESGRSVVANSREETPLPGLFLDETAESVLAVPVPEAGKEGPKGIFFLFSPAPYAFSGAMIQTIEELISRMLPLEEEP